MASCVPITFSEFLNLTPKQVQRLSFAANKAGWLKAGGKLEEYKDPIIDSIEFKQKKGHTMNSFLERLSKRSGNKEENS